MDSCAASWPAQSGQAVQPVHLGARGPPASRGQRDPQAGLGAIGRSTPLISAHGVADGTPAGTKGRGAPRPALRRWLAARRGRRGRPHGLDRTDASTWALSVRGKGRRERIVYIGDGAKDTLNAWLELRGDDEGPLFQPVDKAGRVRAGRGMTGRAIARRVELRSEQARIGRFSPHVLRRTFATRALDQGVDVATVADFMGHASLDTTRRYDRRGEQAKRDAMAAIAGPYARTGEGK